MNGASDQGLAVVLSLQVSGLTSAATTATAGVGVGGLADQHLALEVHRLGGSQKLEGFKTEAGVIVEARCVDLVGAVYGASTDETGHCHVLPFPPVAAAIQSFNIKHF